MSRAIHQLLKTIVPGDAISMHTLAIRNILREHGFESEIFVETCHPALVSETRTIEDYARYSHAETLLLFHFSQGTPLAEYVLTLPDKLVLIYHNITPERYFRRVHHEAWLSLIQGREQLPRLAGKAVLGMADSEYNRRELIEVGCSRTGVLPIILDFSMYDRVDSALVLDMFRDKVTTFLFVGRVTPNKGHDHLLKFLYYYHKIDPAARLIITGQYYGFEPYLYKLNEMITRLRLENVHCVGHVSHQELCTYYRLADLFTCFSLHEGFCVPLLESMYFDLPILAVRGTAIEDTLAGAGMVLAEFDPLEAAETAAKIISDQNLLSKIVSGQRERLRCFERSMIEPVLLEQLAQVGAE
ncbi:glycosyltransferase [bacterium]|nr:glycosyltransferase [bacterium]